MKILTNILGVEVKNFKGITHLKLDLTSNVNGLERDIKLGFFRKTADGKRGIPSYIAILGRNAIGKTSLLEAIAFAGDLSNNTISNMAKKQLVDERTGAAFLGNSFTANDDPLQITNSFMKDRERIYAGVESDLTDVNSLTYSEYNVIVRKLLKSIHNHACTKLDKDIEITIEVEHDNKISKISHKISNSGRFIASLETGDSKMTDKEKDLLLVDLRVYLSKLLKSTSSYSINNMFQDQFDSRQNINNVHFLSGLIISLRDAIGLKKLTSLLKLSDPSLEKIIIHRTRQDIEIVESIIVNGRSTRLLSFSSGTKHFLNMLHKIIFPKIANQPSTLVLIDEIEIAMHKELIDALKILMIEMFEKYNTQYIFTTHSPLVLKNFITNKQIFSMDLDPYNKHVIDKFSAKHKPHQNPIKAYLDGAISPYPDPELLRNTVGGILD